MKNVLIIDDDLALCTLLKSRIEHSGDYHVDMFTSARQGVEKLKDVVYNAIVLDVLMPDMSGFETVKRIRSMAGESSRTPIIVISARPSMKEVFHFSEIRAFLAKPFDDVQLLDVLDRTCGVERKEKPVVVTAVLETKPAGPQQPKILVAAMEKYMLTKVSEYLQPLGCTVLTTSDEEDALSLAKGQQPNVIIYQYWEEPEKFNAAKLFTRTQQGVDTQQLRCLVVCPKNLEMQASNELPKSKLFSYSDSRELLTKLRQELAV